MELIINIPEQRYKEIINEESSLPLDILCAIRNGKTLPKGHGRLIDADARRLEIDEEDRWVVDLAGTAVEQEQ